MLILDPKWQIVNSNLIFYFNIYKYWFLPLEPESAMINGPLVEWSSDKQALPTESRIPDSCFKIFASKVSSILQPGWHFNSFAFLKRIFSSHNAFLFNKINIFILLSDLREKKINI